MMMMPSTILVSIIILANTSTVALSINIWGSSRSRISTFALRAGATGDFLGDSDDDDVGDAGDDEFMMPVVDYQGDGPPERAVVLMDAFCPYHGGYVARSILERYRETAVVTVVSDYLHGFLTLQQRQQQQDDNNKNEDDVDDTNWDALRVPKSLEGWKQIPVEWTAVYCESDSGLAAAEGLRQRLDVKCQDVPCVSEVRRQKYLMNEAVAEANKLQLLTARQRWCHTLEEALEFFEKEQQQSSPSTKSVIIKPIRGVASESVHLCSTSTDVELAWERITSSVVFGASTKQHDSVLVQEYLEGPEYAVDVVSRDGHHKVAAVWTYDKRRATSTNSRTTKPENDNDGCNGPFVYYATKLVDASSNNTSDDEKNVIEQVCAYIEGALTATGVRWGISHNEVIWTRDRGPVLVELNCRQHNMDFIPIVDECLGYNALDMVVDAWLGDDALWESIPSRPPPLIRHGRMVHLVNSAPTGRLESCNIGSNDGKNDDEPFLQTLNSMLAWHIYPPFTVPGNVIKPTTDIRTDAGWVQLVHEDADAVERDYQRIVDWMPGLFTTTPLDEDYV